MNRGLPSATFGLSRHRLGLSVMLNSMARSRTYASAVSATRRQKLSDSIRHLPRSLAASLRPEHSTAHNSLRKLFHRHCDHPGIICFRTRAENPYSQAVPVRSTFYINARAKIRPVHRDYLLTTYCPAKPRYVELSGHFQDLGCLGKVDSRTSKTFERVLVHGKGKCRYQFYLYRLHSARAAASQRLGQII